MLRLWLPLVVYCTAVICLPFPSPTDDEIDNESSRKILGSSVVTSVSVIMDLGNGTKKYYADAAGKPVPKPTSASMLGSPPNLLHPDRYEFYTFNEAGDLVKRLMTLEEIQGIIASGDGESGELPPNYYHQELPVGLKSPTLLGEGEIGELSSPVEGVHEVVESVQNVLKEEMEAAKTKTPLSTTSKPATTHSGTWTPGELMDTSTSKKTSTATTPTTYRPSSRKPVKRPSTRFPSSKTPTTATPRTTVSSTTTKIPSSTPPQKIYSRKPISSSTQLPAKKPVSFTTKNPMKSTPSSTNTYSTFTTNRMNMTTIGKVPEMEEKTSKKPITSDIDSNVLDNEVSYASASNVNTEILNNTNSNASETSSTDSPPQKYSDKDELVSKIVTSSWATVTDKTTENHTQKYQNSNYAVSDDNEYSEDSSVTSIQNIKPSVTIIANSTINTISSLSSAGQPGFQNVPNNSGGTDTNTEPAHNSGNTKPNKNSSTSIQNVEPMVTVIINSTVNTASGASTIRDPVSSQPFFENPESFIPGAPNFQASPTLTVTEKIAAGSSSQEYTTADSSSEEDSSENSDSVESVSTELPENILSTLLQLLGADVTTQSSEENESSEEDSEMSLVAKTNETVGSSNAIAGQVDTDTNIQILGSTADNHENTVASPSETSSTNITQIAERIQPIPLANDNFFAERNQSISSIVEMLMDSQSTSETTEPILSAQNTQASNENTSIPLQEETKISPTTFLIPPNESTQNSNVTAITFNKTVNILTPPLPETGTIVLYSNNLLADAEKPEIKFASSNTLPINEENFNKTQASTTPKSTSAKTSVADFILETTTTILETHGSTTDGLSDTDSEEEMLNIHSTETFSPYTALNENSETSSIIDTNTKLGNADISPIGSKIPAPSEIDEVIEKGTISPDSYFLIANNGGAVEESDLVAPPKPVLDKSATNESEIQNAEASTNINSASSDKKYAITKLNATENYTTISPLINSEIDTKVAEADDSEKTYSTSLMSTISTKKPATTTPDLSVNIAAAQSGLIPLKISPELAESVSNVLSQVSKETATTILAIDEGIISDSTTQITTTNFDDSPTMTLLSSTIVNQPNQNVSSTSQVEITHENTTGAVYNASIETIPQDTNISQGSLNTAETNKIFNTITTRLQETTTSLYSPETTNMFTMDDKVQEESDDPLLKQSNTTDINEIVKEDIKELEIETKVDVKNRGNVSDENVNIMPGHENVNKNSQNGSTALNQTQDEIRTAASSVVDKHTHFSKRQNGSLRVPSEERESTTIMSLETATLKLVESAEETSTTLFADTPSDVSIQMSKNKLQDIVSVPEVTEQTTTLLPTFTSTENMVTDKLVLASQIKGTQVKLIDNEEEQMLKVDTVTAPNRGNNVAGVANQSASEVLSTATWQKIFDSSEKEANKSTTSKFVETSAVTDSIKETNDVDVTSSDNVSGARNTTETSTASDTTAIENKQNVDNVLEGGNSIVTEEKPNGTIDSSANKNASKIITVSGITQAIFHTEVNDQRATTEEPVITTTNFASLVVETVLPSKYVESVANPDATSAEETNTEVATTEVIRTEYPGNETATELEADNEVNATEKTWALVSTVIPTQTKMTTSRTADQTTKAHVDTKVTTLGDIRRPGQPPAVDLRPAPEENLGLEATTFNQDKDVRDFVELCNELALKLWKPVANKRTTVSRSLVMSPFAVTSLLAMVFLGARGGTSGQMNDILRLDDMVTFNPHQVFRNVTESLVMSKNPGIATAAFVRELYSDRTKGKLLDFYKERAQQFYDGHVEEVNFNMVGDVVRRRTNLLVKRQTSSKVPEYIRGSNIMLRPPLSVFSANIFQTDCREASTTGRDGEMYFTVIPSSRQRRLVPVPAVVWRSGFLAGYDPMLDATAVAIGGADSLVSTVLVLPGQQGNTAPGDSVAALEDRLWNSPSSQGAWSRLLRSLLPRPGLELQLPRFSHRSMLNMTGTLQRMGLEDLFSEGRADLKGLNGLANDLHLSDIVQVNTFGTCGELAADARHHVEIFPGTSQRMGRRDDESLLPDLSGIPLALRPRQARLPESPRLRLEQPFLYAVRHNPTGLILHMGRFNPRLVR